MTKKELEEYKGIKDEITDLNRRIEETKKVGVVDFGTVKGSSKYFPYAPKTFQVAGIDPSEATRRTEEIRNLLRQREVRRDELVKEQIKIEQYIAEINNSTARTIFRMYYMDGLSQNQIARKINYTQGRISQILKNYLKINIINK